MSANSDGKTVGIALRKAEEAGLEDWVAYIRLLPSIATFNESVDELRKEKEYSSDIIEAWEDLLDDIEPLSIQVSILSNTQKRTFFHDEILKQMNISLRDTMAYSYADLIGESEVSLSSLLSGIKRAQGLLPFYVESYEKLLYLKGLVWNDHIMVGNISLGVPKENVRNTMAEKIMMDTLPSAIKIARESLGPDATSVGVIKFLTSDIGYSKDSLPLVITGLKAHQESQVLVISKYPRLLRRAKEVDEGMAIFGNELWNGYIVNTYVGTEYHFTLRIEANDESPVDPIGILEFKNNEIYRVPVHRMDSEGFSINILGNDEYDAKLNSAGSIDLKKYYSQDTHGILTSVKSTEKAAKIASEKASEMMIELKKEPWYGVPFYKSGGHFIPASVLLKLNFINKTYDIKNYGFGSLEKGKTTFDMSFNSDGTVQLNDKVGVKTAQWVSGDKWQISFNNAEFIASIAATNSTAEWKVIYLKESDYLARLKKIQGLLSNSSWSAGGIDQVGVPKDNWNGKIAMGVAKINSGMVTVEGGYAFDGGKVDLTYMAVPALAGDGVVLSSLKFDSNVQTQMSHVIFYSEDITNDAKLFKSWGSAWAYKKE